MRSHTGVALFIVFILFSCANAGLTSWLKRKLAKTAKPNLSKQLVQNNFGYSNIPDHGPTYSYSDFIRGDIPDQSGIPMRPNYIKQPLSDNISISPSKDKKLRRMGRKIVETCTSFLGRYCKCHKRATDSVPVVLPLTQDLALRDDMDTHLATDEKIWDMDTHLSTDEKIWDEDEEIIKWAKKSKSVQDYIEWFNYRATHGPPEYASMDDGSSDIVLSDNDAYE